MAEDPRWVRVQMWRPVREALEAAEASCSRRRPPARGARGRAGRRRQRPAGTARRVHCASGAPCARRSRRARPGAGRGARAVAEAPGHDRDHRLRRRARASRAGFARRYVAAAAHADRAGRDRRRRRPLLRPARGAAARADVHALIFEIHLYCLRAGFVGRYRERRHDLERLQQRVAQRVLGGQGRRPHAPAPRRRAGEPPGRLPGLPAALLPGRAGRGSPCSSGCASRPIARSPTRGWPSFCQVHADDQRPASGGHERAVLPGRARRAGRRALPGDAATLRPFFDELGARWPRRDGAARGRRAPDPSRGLPRGAAGEGAMALASTSADEVEELFRGARRVARRLGPRQRRRRPRAAGRARAAAGRAAQPRWPARG